MVYKEDFRIWAPTILPAGVYCAPQFKKESDNTQMRAQLKMGCTIATLSWSICAEILATING